MKYHRGMLASSGYSPLLHTEATHDIERFVLYEERCTTKGCVYPAMHDKYICKHCLKDVVEAESFQKKPGYSIFNERR